MKRDTKNYRDMAKALRDAADAADKLVDVMENTASTEAELEEAIKEFMWKVAKLAVIK